MGRIDAEVPYFTVGIQFESDKTIRQEWILNPDMQGADYSG